MKQTQPFIMKHKDTITQNKHKKITKTRFGPLLRPPTWKRRRLIASGPNTGQVSKFIFRKPEVCTVTLIQYTSKEIVDRQTLPPVRNRRRELADLHS